VVTVRTKLTGITGFKLEALTDASLGDKKGPGRADEPNFVLNNFTVTATSERGAKAEVVKLVAAGVFFANRAFLSNVCSGRTTRHSRLAIARRFTAIIGLSSKRPAAWVRVHVGLPAGAGFRCAFARLAGCGCQRSPGPELPVAAARSVRPTFVAILNTTGHGSGRKAQTKRLTEFLPGEDKQLERMRVDK